MELLRCVFLTFLLFVRFACPIFGKTVALDNLEIKVSKGYDAINGMWCPAWRDLICGSDGITYWNECIFKAAEQLKPGLEVVKQGPCVEQECEDCEDEPNEGKLEICGSNGQTFPSICKFDCYVETYPLLHELYKHCEYEYPTFSEFVNATADVYNDVVAAYLLKYKDIIEEYRFQNISMAKTTFLVELGGEEVQIKSRLGTIGDLSTIEQTEPMYFYAYSDLFARLKIVFTLKTFELRIPKFTATGGKLKIKGVLTITVKNNRFELIADLKAGENGCPLIQALSLRLADVDDLIITLDPTLEEKPTLAANNLMKEKIVTITNDVISPHIVQKLSEIACLNPHNNSTRYPENRCYGFFQTRICF